MEAVLNKLEKSIVEVEVTFDGKEWKDAQSKALNGLAAKVNLPGFRKGKAPINMIKARVGKGAILEEATDLVLKKNYSSIITDNNIQLVGQPQVEVTEINEDVLKVKIACPVMPEIKLGEYKGLEVKKTAVRVTKKEIDDRIAAYQNDFAELVVKEGTVENGDTAVIDFEGFKDGVAFDGGKGENHPLEIGSGSFIPGFEEQLIGMSVNEEKEINVTFPEDYHVEDLAGAAVVFKVTVHEIKSKVLPEIDDELAKDVNIDGVETLEDLEKHVKEDIRVQKQNEADNKFNDELIDALIANTEIDLPDVMVENEIDKMVKEIENNLAVQGATLDLYLQIMGKTKEEMREELREEATRRTKYTLILIEVSKAEKIEVTDEDVEAEYIELAATYGRDVKEIREALKDQVEYIKEDLALKKALELIKDNVK